MNSQIQKLTNSATYGVPGADQQYIVKIDGVVTGSRITNSEWPNGKRALSTVMCDRSALANKLIQSTQYNILPYTNIVIP